MNILSDKNLYQYKFPHISFEAFYCVGNISPQALLLSSTQLVRIIKTTERICFDNLFHNLYYWCGPGSSGIATDYGLEPPGSNTGGDEIFRPSRPALGPPSLQYNVYWVFPLGKVRPGRASDHSPPSIGAAMEEYSYNSTHPLGHTGPLTGSLYLLLYIIVLITDKINYGTSLVSNYSGCATGWTILRGQVGATSGRGKT